MNPKSQASILNNRTTEDGLDDHVECGPGDMDEIMTADEALAAVAGADLAQCVLPMCRYLFYQIYMEGLLLFSTSLFRKNMNNLRKHHVASGSYYISRNTPLILQAFLGTCVGVALYDEEAGVGGLFHLLLPEPVSEAGSYEPEKYASTGLPIFLRALYDEGASKNR